MPNVVLFFAKLVELMAEMIFIYAKEWPILVGSLGLAVALGGLVLGVMHVCESPTMRYRRKIFEAEHTLRHEEEALHRITKHR